MSVTVLHPEPGDASERLRLHRAGLIGLYEYEDETFEFERGRLLLRGPNGSGKSKALELLLPLLLDGELRAERLDPFGGRGRSMRWNLIGDQESRAPAVGYSWLELHRRDDHGVEYFHTLVLMARANKGESGVHSWFALLEAYQDADGELHGPRIGVNASLTEGRHPISRAAFAELAGGLIESASVYRERVNALLFGVAQDRYEAIVRLLLSLRKPQLSQTLDPQELSARLTEALPELDRDAVLRVSSRLDQLDRMRAEAAELREVRTAVEAFAKTYRDWARAALRERGRVLIDAVGAREEHSEALARAQEAIRVARERRSTLAARRRELESTLASARGAERELRASDDWRAAERMEELRRLADAARKAASAATTELARAADELAELQDAAARADAALGEQRTAVESLLQALRGEADHAGIAAHEAAVEGLVQEERDLVAVRSLLEQLADARAEAITALTQLARALGVADQEFRAARSRFEDAEARQRERQTERASAVERLGLVRSELVDALDGWLAGLEQLAVDDAFAEELAALLARAGEPGAPSARELAHDRAGAAEQRLRDQLAGVAAARVALAAEHEPLAAEHERLSAHEDPVPEPLPFRTADRAGRPGAPLWALVDFSDGLDGDRRAGLEGALEGAGLLDAWVMPDGAVLDADDALLVASAPDPAEAGAGRTLAEALVPVSDAPVAAPIVAGLLARLALSDSGAPTADGAAYDGSFALGPLRGRRRVDAARYIGAAARAANRARRLAELASELAAIEQRDHALQTQATELGGAVARLREEVRRLPDDAPAHARARPARARARRGAACGGGDRGRAGDDDGPRRGACGCPRARARARARAPPSASRGRDRPRGGPRRACLLPVGGRRADRRGAASARPAPGGGDCAAFTVTAPPVCSRRRRSAHASVSRTTAPAVLRTGRQPSPSAQPSSSCARGWLRWKPRRRAPSARSAARRSKMSPPRQTRRRPSETRSTPQRASPTPSVRSPSSTRASRASAGSAPGRWRSATVRPMITLAPAAGRSSGRWRRCEGRPASRSPRAAGSRRCWPTSTARPTSSATAYRRAPSSRSSASACRTIRS